MFLLNKFSLKKKRIIGEYAYYDLLKKPKFIQLNENRKITPNPNRGFIRIIEDGEKLLKEIKNQTKQAF